MDPRPPLRRPARHPAPDAAARQEAARDVAVAALQFIAGAPAELQRFLALTGIEAGAVRAAAAELGFLEGVLAYIAGNERTLLAFTAGAGLAPEAVETARLTLAAADPAPPQT